MAQISEKRFQEMLEQALEQLRDHSIKQLPVGKDIRDWTGVELNAAIDRAAVVYGKEFWDLLTGIDAYQERRRRKYG